MANPMSYAGAGEPAPNINTTNDDLFFLALLNHIFAQHNADDTILFAIKALTDAATPTATLGALAKRDATQGTLSANGSR
jgi:hypothetical protein